MKLQKPAKTKMQQPKTPEKKQERDNFLTPVYATNLIIPYIPKNVKVIWDVGAGRHNITRVLKNSGYRVFSTDIDGQQSNIQHNFITQESFSFIESYKIDMLVSNVPFSLKPEFIDRAIGTGLPFSFLIPFDMSGYLWDAFKNRGLQAIIPERRIDFITPNIVNRVNDYMGLWAVYKEFKKKYKMKDFLNEATSEEIETYQENHGYYESIEEIPNDLLRKVSSSDFHSFWICGNMNLKNDFTFVNLSNKEKDNIL